MSDTVIYVGNEEINYKLKQQFEEEARNSESRSATRGFKFIKIWCGAT